MRSTLASISTASDDSYKQSRSGRFVVDGTTPSVHSTEVAKSPKHVPMAFFGPTQTMSPEVVASDRFGE
jgi:hypothetical protein